MALNFSNFETALQAKLDTITDEKDMLLLGKAIEATVGNVAVSDLQTEGSVQKAAVAATGSTEVSAVQAQGTSERNQINAMSSGFATSSSLATVATSGNAQDLSNLKTVGGQSITGSGNIATLPSGGSAGQVLKKDGSNNASWGTDEGGALIKQTAVEHGTTVTLPTTSAEYVFWSTSFNREQSDSDIILLGIMPMMGSVNWPDIGDFIQVGNYKTQRGVYHSGHSSSSGPWTWTINTRITAAQLGSGTGSVVLKVGWNKGGASQGLRPATVWNPSFSNDNRVPGSQTISQILIMEVKA